MFFALSIPPHEAIRNIYYKKTAYPCGYAVVLFNQILALIQSNKLSSFNYLLFFVQTYAAPAATETAAKRAIPTDDEPVSGAF